MPRSHDWTTERTNQAIAWRKEGVTAVEIGRRLKVSAVAVRHKLSKIGVKLDPELRAEMNRNNGRGVSASAGVSPAGLVRGIGGSAAATEHLDRALAVSANEQFVARFVEVAMRRGWVVRDNSGRPLNQDVAA